MLSLGRESADLLPPVGATVILIMPDMVAAWAIFARQELQGDVDPVDGDLRALPKTERSH